MTVENEVVAIIAEQLGIDQSEVTPKKSLIEDLNADSLDLTELIMVLEEKFDVEIPEKDAEQLKLVEDVINFVAKLKSTGK